MQYWAQKITKIASFSRTTVDYKLGQKL